jgi:hypothetical protein
MEVEYFWGGHNSIYLIVSPPYNLLESRRSYFTKPYYCDLPRNIRLPFWSDHDIAGLHRIISIFDKRKLGRCIVEAKVKRKPYTKK